MKIGKPYYLMQTLSGRGWAIFKYDDKNHFVFRAYSGVYTISSGRINEVLNRKEFEAFPLPKTYLKI
jgi:hypothetical protein